MRQASSPAVGSRGLPALVVTLGVVVGLARAGQLNPDEAALVMLNAGRRAYNERNYAAAAGQFREFLRAYGGHREAPAAHYGLALALLEGPTKDYPNAINELGQVANRADAPDQPSALYFLGSARRSLGYQELALAGANPNEAQARRNNARQQFEGASRDFASAAAAFTARAKAAADAEQGANLLDWAARAACDQCEMLLRTDKFKEAGDLAEAFLLDPAMGRSRYRDLGLYQFGYARFALKDYLAAGRALSQLAPFGQDFGLHARYLLARIHHLSDEAEGLGRPEAAAQYKAVLAGYDEAKKAAQAALGNPAALQPDQKELLEALVKDPPPDYVPRSAFYSALLQAEAGRFADALAGFAALAQQYPKSDLIPEARLRQGFCQLELRSFPEAIATLQPLVQHPQLGDQALWWVTRAQVGAADPKNAQAYGQVLSGAVGALRQAADRAGQLAQADPAARVRRGDILMDLADTQQLAGQFREAAATYQQVQNEKTSPDRIEEAMQRQATALHLAGQIKESDDLCARFEAALPTSTLLPAVLFRSAENAYAAAMAAAAKPDLANRDQELARLFGEAIRRYQRLITRFPEFPYVNLARQGMATAHYQLGHCADTLAILGAIPDPDRTGDLATVPYLMADCLIRLFPTETDDALRAVQLVDQASQAAKLLEAFLAGQPNAPEAPDALLKLGHCYSRVATVMANPEEQKKQVTLARGAYERFLQQFAKDPAMPTAVFERAKCIALLGDLGGAINELNRFQGDPLRQSAVAPLALLRLSALLRAQNRAADAANALGRYRGEQEANLLKDPARRGWVPTLQYEHALAVKESGKIPEARALFEALVKAFPDSPEAVNALWRGGQCLREELTARLADARAALAGGGNPQQVAAAAQAVDQAQAALRQALDGLQAQADALGRKVPGSESHLRMLYEVAWCCRALADADLAAARQALQQQALEAVRARLARQSAGGQPPALLPLDIPDSAISMRLPERAAHDAYRRLIGAAPGALLAIQARLELAEMLSARGGSDEALALLAEAVEKSPPQDLAERVRLRLAAAFLTKKEPKSAIPHVQAVLANKASPLAAEALYLAGETSIQLEEWPRAIDLLVPFRDQGPLQNVAGISDRALLALGRACAQAKQWDQSRQACETLCQRFGQSPWFDEARFGVGWALQNQSQLDNAVNVYAEVTRRTAAEVAARAQFQIGLCRLEQKRYPEAALVLLAVPCTYDYPDWSAAATCEAARACKEMNQPAEAVRLLQLVLKDYPKSRWAPVAQQRLAEINK